MNLISRPSPNYNDRPDGSPGEINMIVLHYTGMKTGNAALDRLTDRDAGVSAHYLAETNGDIYELVAPQYRAWHAGVSHWQGIDGVNDCSIGIEIVNHGHEWGYEKFPDEQIDAVIELVAMLKARYNIPNHRIIGHSDVAPTRKEDPGELFPWIKFAFQDLGVMPYSVVQFEKDLRDAKSAGLSRDDLIEQNSFEKILIMLSAIGYYIDGNNHAAAVLAFQRHYCIDALGQGLNLMTKLAIVHIHSQCDI